VRLRLIMAAAIVVGAAFPSHGFAKNLLVTINKSSQKMTVSMDGVETYTWLVSTGGYRYSTPSGTFKPFRMERDYFSKQWDNAPMPHAIFFTMQGHAIHGSPHTKRLGTPVSHGCVRLAPANAAKLYALVQETGMKNTRVIVRGGFDFGFDNFASSAPRKKSAGKGELPPVVQRNFNLDQLQ
jgi:L,D-transpeptidase catalytic domain